MNDDEMARRLRPVREIVTPTLEVENQILRVDQDGVTLKSDRTGNERTIPYRDIRNNSTANGCIIESLRQILGL